MLYENFTQSTLFMLGYVFTAELILSSAATQPRLASYSQSETIILVSDWLKIIGFGWVAAELTVN